MKKISYKILRTRITDIREAEIGKDIFYKCGNCLSIIPSTPKDNINCKCANISIDKDMHRLFVEDYEKFIVLKKIKN